MRLNSRHDFRVTDGTPSLAVHSREAPRRGWKRLLVMGLVVGLWVFSFAARIQSAERVRVAGREYVAVGDWARSRGLEFRWVKRDETVQAGNDVTKIVFDVDS